jgi:pyruvate/2-oxoglutarate dehydrogenase complex dihydrolipoamide acyltransferase (E2) component
MPTRINIPKMNMGMQEGSVSEWMVADGDRIAAGQIIYVLESDKVETEIESPASGTIHLFAEAGRNYPVGTKIAEIEEDS